MKSFIAMMVLLSVSISYTYAGEEGKVYEKKQPTKMEDRAVIDYDHDLELELENGVVEAEWDEFEIEGFDWFKLVYSSTNSAPVYPDDRTVFVGSKDQTEAEFKLDSGATNHYVRLCAVVLNEDYSKDRYCGKVQKVEWNGEYEKGDNEKEYVKKVQEEKYSNKKQELEKKMAEKQEQIKKQYAEKKQKVVKTALSASMKNRIDSVIENFVEKLEDRGYSDAQMTSAINTVISRLGEFKNKTGYKEIVVYMTTVLEQYREEYSNPLEDLESIFEGL